MNLSVGKNSSKGKKIDNECREEGGRLMKMNANEMNDGWDGEM